MNTTPTQSRRAAWRIKALRAGCATRRASARPASTQARIPRRPPPSRESRSRKSHRIVTCQTVRQAAASRVTSTIQAARTQGEVVASLDAAKVGHLDVVRFARQPVR